MVFNYTVYNYTYNNHYILYQWHDLCKSLWYNSPVNHIVLIYFYVTLTLSSEGWVGIHQVYWQTVAGMKANMCKGPEMQRWKEDSRNWRRGKESMSWRERVKESSAASGWWSPACRGPYTTSGSRFWTLCPAALLRGEEKRTRVKAEKTTGRRSSPNWKGRWHGLGDCRQWTQQCFGEIETSLSDWADTMVRRRKSCIARWKSQKRTSMCQRMGWTWS